jgi:hypothetical protein
VVSFGGELLGFDSVLVSGFASPGVLASEERAAEDTSFSAFFGSIG